MVRRNQVTDKQPRALTIATLHHIEIKNLSLDHRATEQLNVFRTKIKTDLSCGLYRPTLVLLVETGRSCVPSMLHFYQYILDETDVWPMELKAGTASVELLMRKLGNFGKHTGRLASRLWIQISPNQLPRVRYGRVRQVQVLLQGAVPRIGASKC